MTAPTGRKVWFLTDPIEDWPRDWVDYKKNYQATFTAQLLYPQIANYEVMPWPERIYEGLYKKSADSDEKIRIPKHYSTMMQIMINALNDIPLSNNQLSGSQGISVMMGNSLMFQRFPNHEGYEDPQLANFYGLTLPFVKRGVPVGITHIENLGYPKTLENVKVLLMTYSNMKPMDPKAHEYLADWVNKGGILVYSATDSDPFQNVKEWWNSGENSFTTPSNHLFSLMKIEENAAEGVYSVGKGKVYVLRSDPKEYVLTQGADNKLIEAVKEMYGNGLEFKNNFTLNRGAYTLVAVMDESVSDDPYILEGNYIDLFDPELPAFTSKEIQPGTQGFFYDVSKAGKAPKVLASAGRNYEEKKKGKSFSYIAKSPIETINATRALLPKAPKSILVDGKELISESSWDETSHTVLFKFDNNPDGVKVEIYW